MRVTIRAWADGKDLYVCRDHHGRTEHAVVKDIPFRHGSFAFDWPGVVWEEHPEGGTVPPLPRRFSQVTIRTDGTCHIGCPSDVNWPNGYSTVEGGWHESGAYPT